jgi:surface antigen
MRRKAFRRRALRIGFVTTNIILLGVVLAVVLQDSHSTSSHKSTLLGGISSADSSSVNPLDQVSSADIALTVARMSSLSESTAITNQAESQAADSAIASASDNVISKPQVVATALKSKSDIQSYTAVGGDTVSGIAAKFGVTSDSIRWSNGLNSDAVNAGTKLTIPPVNGIVYTVKSGDTPDSLAAKFRANKDKIVAYNDAEITGLKPGDQIIIPDAVQVATASASTVSRASFAGASFPWGSGPIYGYNGYDYGYCTWYVATQIAVPSNWGNASSWSYYASLSGWHVSSRPTVGAIAQTPYAAGGLGHVAIVDAVSPDGTQIQYRDMNGIAGWGRVGYSGWVPASHYPHYITH